MSKEELKTLQNKRFFRAKELAEHLGVGLATIWYWNKQKKITSKKISERVTVFDIAEVEKALFGEEVSNG